MSNVPEKILKKMRESIPKRPQIQLVDDLNYPEPTRNNTSASTSTTSRTLKRKRTVQSKATSNKTRRLSGNKPSTEQQPKPYTKNKMVRQVAPVTTKVTTHVPDPIKPSKATSPTSSTRFTRRPKVDCPPLRSVSLERTPARRALQGSSQRPTETRSLDRDVPKHQPDADLKPGGTACNETDAHGLIKRKREEVAERNTKRNRTSTDVKSADTPQTEVGKKKEERQSSTTQQPLSASFPSGSPHRPCHVLPLLVSPATPHRLPTHPRHPDRRLLLPQDHQGRHVRRHATRMIQWNHSMLLIQSSIAHGRIYWQPI